MGILSQKEISFILSLCSLTFPIPFLLCVANLFHLQVEADDTRFERDNKTNGKPRLTQGVKKKKPPKEKENEKKRRKLNQKNLKTEKNRKANLVTQ